MSKKHVEKYYSVFAVFFLLLFAVFASSQIFYFIKNSSDYRKHYIAYIQALNNVHKYFIEFDIHFDSYTDKQSISLAAARISFEEVQRSYRSVLGEYTLLQFFGHESLEDHHNFMKQVGANIDAIRILLSKFDEKTASEEQFQEFDRKTHSYVDQAYRTIALFENEAMEDYANGEVSLKMKHKQDSMIFYAFYLLLLSILLGLCYIFKSHYARQQVDRQQTELDLLQKCLSALDSARDAILITDEEQNIVYVNRALCALNDFSFKTRDSLVNKPWADVLHEKIVATMNGDIMPELRNKSYWVGEVSIALDDDKKVDAELSITKLSDGGMVATFQDLSDKYRAEQEKRQLEDQFFQAQKMEAIGRLAGGIAHDFNNILAAINGYAEFLVDDLDEDCEQFQFANNILLAGIQARGLTDQLLSFSRRSDVVKDTIDLVLSVDETVSMLRATLPKTIELDRDVNVPRALIQGNPTQISQLLMNLCLNGADAIEDEHGRLKIVIDAAPADQISEQYSMPLFDSPVDDNKVQPISLQDLDGGRTRLICGRLVYNTNYAKISVQDTGSGMSRTIMEHIFEPFFTTKAVDKGTGLGLAMVHGVVLTHNAFMLIDTTLGRGTSFEIYLPLADDEMSTNIVAPIGKDYTQEKVKTARHILLVEDQENVRLMILKMLERLGYKTSSATSGLEGLDMIRENPDLYDLVITDQNMPSMTGIEMVSQIHLDLPDIPFVVLSGYSEEKIQEMIQGHDGIKAVIRKPVSKDILAMNIRAVLGRI